MKLTKKEREQLIELLDLAAKCLDARIDEALTPGEYDPGPLLRLQVNRDRKKRKACTEWALRLEKGK